jgi:hypothetical protein
MPEIISLNAGAFPTLAEIEAVLGPITVHRLPIPADCIDGFLGAYWRRPAAYLDPGVRKGISSFALIDDVDAKLRTLERDLASGAWMERHADLVTRDVLDIGYRIVIAQR